MNNIPVPEAAYETATQVLANEGIYGPIFVRRLVDTLAPRIYRAGQIDMCEHVLSLMEGSEFPFSTVEPVIRRRLAALRQEGQQ